MRDPDFIIGQKENPYLRRWWVIPRNRWFNIYLHQILRSDDDRAMHDHPWANLSIILRGAYVEASPGPFRWITKYKVRRAGSLVFRRPTALHRLIVDRPTWTLFITGPVVRVWGFACPKGWVPWQKFVDDRDNGQVGAGCGEDAA